MEVILVGMIVALICTVAVVVFGGILYIVGGAIIAAIREETPKKKA